MALKGPNLQRSNVERVVGYTSTLSRQLRGAGEGIRKKLEVYTEVYIVFIFVYFHVILPYLVTTLLDCIHFSRFSTLYPCMRQNVCEGRRQVSDFP